MRASTSTRRPVRRCAWPSSARVAQGGAPGPRPVARRPTASSTASDGVKIVFGESAEPAAPAPLAALRASEPAPRRAARPRPRPSTRPRAPVRDRAAGVPALPEPQAPAPRTASRRPLRSRQHRQACGQKGDPAPDQPRLQGRRPAGHLPALRRHQRPERGREPRRDRQGDPEAQRGALGPGARPDPEDQRPRLHARGQRHPHRQAHRPPEGRARSAQARGGEGARRRPGRLHQAHLLRQGGELAAVLKKAGRSRRAARSTSTPGPTR